MEISDRTKENRHYYIITKRKKDSKGFVDHPLSMLGELTSEEINCIHKNKCIITKVSEIEYYYRLLTNQINEINGNGNGNGNGK